MLCTHGIFKIRKCWWESPEISFGYHIHLDVWFASGGVVMTQPVVLLHDGIKICNRGIVSATALGTLGGYTPQIDTPIPGADAIVNTILRTQFEPFESVTASAIAGGVGWLASGIATIFGNARCII
jgi:hypothetical protein